MFEFNGPLHLWAFAIFIILGLYFMLRFEEIERQVEEEEKRG